MSKEIKQMEMNALEHTFKGVRDLVMMSVQGVNSQHDNQARLGLRKKSIRLQVVKNTLARRVFGQLGLQMSKCWEGPTTVAWGAGSLSELSRELETAFKNNDKVKFKCAVADGQEVSFDQALKMPTRAEAIGRVIMLALSPAGRIAGQLRGPAGKVAGQVKSLSEKKEGEAAPAS
jgi:large subunit ribosomal protein L10